MKIKNGLVCVLVVSVMYFQQNFICAQAQETLPEGHNGYADATYGDKTKYGNDEEGGFNVFQVTVSAEAWHPVSANVETNVSALIQQRDPLGQSGIQLGWNASLEGVGNVKYGLQVERGDWIVSYRVPDGYESKIKGSTTASSKVQELIDNPTSITDEVLDGLSPEELKQLLDNL